MLRFLKKSVTSSTAISTAPSTHDQSGCRLLRLPAEIRSAIFHFALLEDGTLDVASRWPGITGTCKEIRAETLPVFLGRNNFTAYIKDLNDKPLRHWLDTVRGLP